MCRMVNNSKDYLYLYQGDWLACSVPCAFLLDLRARSNVVYTFYTFYE